MSSIEEANKNSLIKLSRFLKIDMIISSIFILPYLLFSIYFSTLNFTNIDELISYNLKNILIFLTFILLIGLFIALADFFIKRFKNIHAFKLLRRKLYTAIMLRITVFLVIVTACLYIYDVTSKINKFNYNLKTQKADFCLKDKLCASKMTGSLEKVLTEYRKDCDENAKRSFQLFYKTKERESEYSQNACICNESFLRETHRKRFKLNIQSFDRKTVHVSYLRNNSRFDSFSRSQKSIKDWLATVDNYQKMLGQYHQSGAETLYFKLKRKMVSEKISPETIRHFRCLAENHKSFGK